MVYESAFTAAKLEAAISRKVHHYRSLSQQSWLSPDPVQILSGITYSAISEDGLWLLTVLLQLVISNLMQNRLW